MIQKQKGCNDIYGKEAKIWKYVDTVIDALMEKYNYNYIRTPIIEATELFHRGVGETTDIVTKESYDFQDKGGRDITLRPEGTAGVVRSYIENKMFGDPNQPVKVYYNGTMYRDTRVCFENCCLSDAISVCQNLFSAILQGEGNDF